jgi:transcriptional regulator with XRE-family HTH domain
MPTLDDDHTGTRIREQRKLARLTQRQLADRIPYSYALLNSVECGLRPATSDFVAAVAQALRIDVTTLTGQPYVTELQRDRLAELVRPIREALDCTTLAPIRTSRPASGRPRRRGRPAVRRGPCHTSTERGMRPSRGDC